MKVIVLILTVIVLSQGLKLREYHQEDSVSETGGNEEQSDIEKYTSYAAKIIDKVSEKWFKGEYDLKQTLPVLLGVIAIMIVWCNIYRIFWHW